MWDYSGLFVFRNVLILYGMNVPVSPELCSNLQIEPQLCLCLHCQRLHPAYRQLSKVTN